MTSTRHTLFSRIILVMAILIALAGAFWVAAKLLEPVAVPPTPLPKNTVKFDPKADVSKNPIFGGLQPLGPSKVEPGELGRVNPFVPLPKEVPTTTAATSTEEPQ